MTTAPERSKTIQSQVADRRLDGLYKQRGDTDFVIVRVRGPGSQWSAEKLRTLARLAERHGDGVLHVTTRGDILLNGVRFGDVDIVLQALRDADMSTRGACGDCPRNITACPGAGVCPNELVDTCRLAQELSKEFVAAKLYEQLPRKFKISISGCEKACALPQIQDIGLVACTVNGATAKEIGFNTYLAGGLGRHPMLAQKIPEVLRPSGLHLFVRSAIECFSDLGDRQRRHRARMKFLAEQLGSDGLLARIKGRLAEQTWHYTI